MTHIALDNGYRFGLGAFETIAIEEKQPIFLHQHLRRLEEALKQLQVEHKGYCREETLTKIRTLAADSTWRRAAVKVIVSEKNIVYSLRENPYKTEMYEEGAAIKLSKVMRNESSPLTYLKTLNYGDNYLEKTKAKGEGYDEVIFLNTGGLLAEGAVSNLFCVKDNVIYTPAVACGLLDGMMRQHMMNTETVKEAAIPKEQLFRFDELFLTNSLMGVMPVRSIDGQQLKTRETGKRLRKKYFEFLASLDNTKSMGENK